MKMVQKMVSEIPTGLLTDHIGELRIIVPRLVQTWAISGLDSYFLILLYSEYQIPTIP